jgi:hypothetical protein
MENNEQYKTLIDMGCNPVLSEAAVKSTKSQDLGALIDWIDANEGKEEHWKEWLANHSNEPEKQEAGEDVPIAIETLINMGHAQ